MKVLFEIDDIFELAEAVYTVSHASGVTHNNYEETLEEIIRSGLIKKSLANNLEKNIDNSMELMKAVTQLILSNKVSFDDLYNLPAPVFFKSNQEWSDARQQIAEPIYDGIRGFIAEINLSLKEKD